MPWITKRWFYGVTCFACGAIATEGVRGPVGGIAMALGLLSLVLFVGMVTGERRRT